jgi:cobalt-zinc-cadmium efflux system membrane fusion protein
MFARLNIDVGDSNQFIAVPREAVLEVDGKEFVYVAEAGNRYVKRPVKTATASNDQVRILEGLAPGERVVTKGAVLIKGQETKAPGA